MKKIIVKIILIFIVIGLGIYIVNRKLSSFQTSDKPTVKIGAILPLTGGMPSMGDAGKKGAQLAIEELNKNPDNAFRYELIIEDVGTDIKRTVPIYKKLVTQDKVKAIISFNSQVGYAIRPLLKKNNVLHISSASDHKIADGQFSFVNSSDVDDGIEKLIQYLQNKGLQKIAIASFNHPAAQNMVEALKAKNLNIVYSSIVNPDERKLSFEVGKIISSNPDAVFLYTYEPLTSLYAKELKQAGFNGKITSLYMLTYSDHPELFEGQTYVDYNMGERTFQEKYNKRFGIQSNSSASVMYDSVILIARLFEENSEPLTNIHDKFVNILKDYQGANGILEMKYNGLMASKPVLVKIKKGIPSLKEE